jgi:hypothetical protein
MARPKKKKRFDIRKLSKTFWVIYFDGVMIGHVTVGSEWNYYFAVATNTVRQDGFTSMSNAVISLFQNLLE